MKVPLLIVLRGLVFGNLSSTSEPTGSPRTDPSRPFAHHLKSDADIAAERVTGSAKSFIDGNPELGPRLSLAESIGSTADQGAPQIICRADSLFGYPGLPIALQSSDPKALVGVGRSVICWPKRLPISSTAVRAVRPRSSRKGLSSTTSTD